MGASKERQYSEFRFGWWPRINIVRQEHASECGLACLTMLLNYYGNPISLPELRRKVAFSGRGLTLTQLIDAAERMDLQARGLRVELHELRNVDLPAIAHIDGSHFVVITCTRGRSVSFIDPALGKRKVSWWRFGEMFTGIILELRSSGALLPKGSKPSFTSLSLFGRVKGIRSSLAWIFVLALTLELTLLLTPLFVQTTVDVVVANHDNHLLAVIALAFLFVIVAQTVISGFRTWAITIVGASLNVGWSSNVFRHLLNLPEEYFNRRHLGDITSRFSGIDSIQRTLSVGVVDVALDIMMALATIVVLYVYSRQMTLVVTTGLLLYLLARLLALKVMMESNIDLITASAKQETIFIESARSSTLIKLNGLYSAQVRRYADQVNDTQQKSVKLQSLMMVFSGVGSVLLGSIKVATLYLGAKASVSGLFSAGMLIAFLAYVDQFTGRCSKLVDFIVSIKLIRVQVNRVFDITQAEPERFSERGFDGGVEHYDLDISNVGFRYGVNDNWIVKFVNLRIREGEFIGIVGVSGSGKSTLIKIMCGLLDAEIGNVSVDGVDIRRLGKRRLREIVSVVMQEDTLMSGTIEQNICGFAIDFSRADVVEAAKVSGVHEAIMAMPMRYETMIGDHGALISGGQKQRLCLARALYRRPKILIMDEATNSLDITTEASVADQISRLSLTRVVVSHRPETLAGADRVYMLESGGVHLVYESETSDVEH